MSNVGEVVRKRILAQRAKPVEPAPAATGILAKAILGACVVVLGLGLALIARNKTSPPPKVEQPIADYATRAELQSVEGGVAKIQDSLGKIADRVGVWAHRTWLLGVVNNENANQMRQTWGEPGVGREFIIFDENWKMSRKPSTMESSDENGEKIDRDVSK